MPPSTQNRSQGQGQGNTFKRGPHSRGPRPPAPREEFRERVLDMRRVTRVVAGGKRFRFRCTLVIGDEKGRVGIGVAKGLDVQQAVAKAKADAKKNVMTIALKDGRTIAHEVLAKYSAAKVLIKPASKGHGLRAGGSVRFVLAFAGIKDATSKVLGRTPNKLTNAMATIEALKKLKA
jgi:small subunit ribosomal protein S5